MVTSQVAAIHKEFDLALIVYLVIDEPQKSFLCKCGIIRRRSPPSSPMAGLGDACEEKSALRCMIALLCMQMIVKPFQETSPHIRYCF